jgi:DNA-binding winged helix-turn-helix (wHTH) protein
MSLRYRFNVFELLPDTRQLLLGTQPMALGARAFDLLLCLVERRDRVVGKDELIAQVWPGTVVGDNNLNVQVSSLRKLLGPQALVTVAGHGYRFGLDVQAHDAAGVYGLAATSHRLRCCLFSTWATTRNRRILPTA